MNPHKDRKKKNRKNEVRSVRISKMVAFLAFFCLCVGGISLVSAKYMQQSVMKNNSATAKEFYFESDLLDGNVHEVVPTENSVDGKTASVTIRLKNHVDELRYSEVAIDYTVTVTNEDGTSAEGVTVTSPSGTIAAGKASTADENQTNDIDVTISNLKAGNTYKVTATTNNVYQKTLEGTIKVAQTDNNIYASVIDKTQYIEVTVWTTDYAGEVKLTYGNIGLIPDNTDTKMANASSAGSTITENSWEANTSHVFRFFKSDTTKSYKAEVNGQEVTVSEQ